MSSAVRLSSDATRPKSRSGILTPDSDGSAKQPSHNASASSGAQKRKRETKPLTMEDLLKPTIVVKPHPPNLMLKPTTLQPLMLLPREHLSLSALDLSLPLGEFPTGPGRFFESRIRILDLEGRLGSSLLLARSEASRHIYAIERQDTGLYALCKLGSWVDVQNLGQHATVCCQQRICPVLPALTPTDEPPLTTPQLHKESKRRRLAIEEIQSMVRKRPRSLSVVAPEQTSLPPALVKITNDSDALPTPSEVLATDPQLPDAAECRTAEPQKEASVPRPDQDIPSQPSAEHIFQNIRSQYFEALYHSMGTLAYFAKGPLSRARAAFHLDCDANLEINDLIQFLKSLVMSTIVIDKKYRESVPEIVSQMKTLVESSDEAGTRTKRKKPKKMKLGKNGLYPTEEEHLKKWWNTHKPEEQDENPSHALQETRYHISCLRTRETQLQMIIILEVLALEALRPADDTADSQLPGMASEQKNCSTDAPAKKREKHNLPVLVDVHADRLCIWQSTRLDEVQVIAESQGLKQGQGGEQANKTNSDPLKDFCVDIIVPFFSARLPEVCDSLSRKLGGPVIVSPLKQKQHKTSTSKPNPKPRPGAAVKRTASSNSSRSLEKALSRDRLRRTNSNAHRPMDALSRMRSVTPATLPAFKREASEPSSLGQIPKQETSSLKERSANQLMRSSSACSTDDLKAQKKAMVEAELHDAISALKKPNRQLMGKAIVEEAEKRVSTTSSHHRKSKKPTRNPLGVVQVKATPANSRFRDAYGGSSQDSHSFHLPRIGAGSEVIHSSSVIPSSAPRGDVQDGRPDLAHISSTPIAHKVQATPARLAVVPNKFLKPNLDDFVIPPSSPILLGKAAAATLHLGVPGSAPRKSPSFTLSPSPNLGGLFDTPIKRRPAAAEEVMKSTPPLPASFTPQAAMAPLDVGPPATTKPQTIYQQLGWDDDDVDDLA